MISPQQSSIAAASGQRLHIVILMPLRDDWISASQLVQRLDRAIGSVCTAEVILVDDGSLQRCSRDDFQQPSSAIRVIRVVRLRHNLGHQRAIAIGLAHIQQNTSCDGVLVMDSDGEDTPEGVVDLLRAYSESGRRFATFAARGRRADSLLFKCFYHLYRFVHLGLTGISVRVGNFSILPPDYLNSLVAMPEMWSHYAASVFRSGLPYSMIPIPRGTRIAGKSKMNFPALVSHGLTAISVFGDIVGVRLLISSLVGSLLAALGIVLVVIIRLFTNRAIPGWATFAAGSLVIIMIQFITIATSFTLFMLFNRTNLGFVPLRDCALFVEETLTIYSHE